MSWFERGKAMQRNNVLKVLNPVLGILALCQIATGVLHGVMPRDVFEAVHQWGGIAFAVTALFHVYLNWNWIKASYFRSHHGTAQ
jgi:hypothetical protein